MSQDLQWLLLRKNNSFLVKRVPEGPIFSKEPGNLRNLHSFKYSGLANSKTIHITDSGSGIQVITPRKAGGKSTSTIRPHSGSRRALGVVSSKAKHGYRADLRTAALARVSALLVAQKPVKADYPVKKSRSKKLKAPARAPAAATAEDSDDDLPALE